MTISIHIEAHPDRGDMGHQVEQAMSALGFRRTPAIDAQAATRPAKATQDEVVEAVRAEIAEQEAAEIAAAHEDANGLEPDAALDTRAVGSADDPIGPIDADDARQVGQPSEGKSRRNSAEKTADDELAALAAKHGITVQGLNSGIKAGGRAAAKAELEAKPEPKADETPAISTGEERVGPEDEQDAADEAAETEKSGLAPIDVLRRLLGDYQKAHGMPAAVKLCQEGGLIGAPIHDLDEAGIEKAIAAMSVSPLSLETKAEPKPVEMVAPKSKGDLIEAMMQYGDKFDGTREQKDMKFTLIDCPAIFTDVFGPEVTKLSLVPENGYGKAVAAIEQAIASDPFGRAK